MLFPYLYPPIYPCWSLVITIPIIKRSASFRKHGLVISLGYSQRIHVVWSKHAFPSLLFRYSSFVRTSEQDDDQGATAAPIDSLYLNLLCPSPSLSLALSPSVSLPLIPLRRSLKKECVVEKGSEYQGLRIVNSWRARILFGREGKDDRVSSPIV